VVTELLEMGLEIGDPNGGGPHVDAAAPRPEIDRTADDFDSSLHEGQGVYQRPSHAATAWLKFAVGLPIQFV
jgi:hypothetical protein